MITPNVKYVFLGQENDLISVTKSGLVHEFEIKLSKADLLADFKKPYRKHDKLRERAPGIPSYFWFVIYEFEICLTEIPDYAGLICISPMFAYGEYWKTVRIKAPQLSKEKITQRMKDGLLRVNNNKLWLERMRNNG